MRARADAVHRSASGFNPDEVVSEVVEVLLDSGLPGIADGHYTDDSGNPNGYAQDCQDASHLVPEQGHNCGSKQGSVVHNLYSFLS
jgi:hypothetical protein